MILFSVLFSCLFYLVTVVCYYLSRQVMED